LVPKHLGVGT